MEYPINKGAEIEKGDYYGTGLHKAALKGNLDVTKYLISKGAEVNVGDNSGLTALHEAALNGHLDVTKYLISAGAEVNKGEIGGWTALHSAAFNGHIDVTKYLISGEAEVNKEDNYGGAALHKAAQKGHLDVTKYLISQGAEVNKANNGGLTALHQAASNGHLDVTKDLINRGAEVNKGDNDGLTALHKAASNGHLDVTKYLISQTEVKQLEKGGLTALHEAASKGHLDVTKYLISEGAEVNKGDNGGLNALHKAASNGHLDVTKYLISLGAEVNKADTTSKTALHSAAFNGHLDVTKYLISEGAEVNKGDNGGLTALHKAAQEGHLDVTKYLISQVAETNKEKDDGMTNATRYLISEEAEINKGDKSGRTALHKAASNGHLNVTKYLISEGAEVNKGDIGGMKALHSAAFNCHLNVTEYLISVGAEVNKENKDSLTALHFAAQKGHLGVTKYLVSHGAEVNRGDRGGLTALHEAAFNGHIDVTKYLISEGAKVNEEDDNGLRALQLAVKNGHTEVMTYLLCHGAEITKQDNDCMTALHHAVQNGNLEIVKVLLAGGASFDIEDIHGQTPLHLSLILGYQSIADLFLDRLNYKFDGDEFTYIHFAIQRGHTSTIEKLVSNGADLNIQSADGQTCLHKAIQLCHKTEKIVQETDTLKEISDQYYQGKLSPEEALVFYLLENGAKLDVKDKAGNLPIQYAKDEVVKHMILSRLSSLEEIQSSRDSEKGIALLNTETAGTSRALADDSDQVTEEAERNNYENLPQRAQSNRTDSVTPLNDALGELTGLDFPQKIDAAQGPLGRQTMTQEPTATTAKPLLDDKSSKNRGNVASGGMDQHSEEVSHDITAHLDSTSDSISSVGKKVHWDFLTDSPQELTIQDNEVLISCGIRFSPSGAKLSETIKVTLDHNAHFSDPRRAEIVFYTRNKGSPTFVRIPASTDCCPRCDVRSNDLDLYVDHFSDWWIVALITWYFRGKRVECTPYVLPPVTKGCTHLLLLCIYDDLMDVIKKTNEKMREYRSLHPPQQMFVEWSCGDINIELFDCSKENAEKIGQKILGKRDMNLVEIKQFDFKVKPLESRASQRFFEFTLDQTESPSYPTLIQFGLPYDATTKTRVPATSTVETVSAGGGAFLTMDASVQAAEVSTKSGFDRNSDATFERLSKHMPAEKYTLLCARLGIGYYEANNILGRVSNDHQRATRSCLAQWKTRTGGDMAELKTILQETDVGDLARYIE